MRSRIVGVLPFALAISAGFACSSSAVHGSVQEKGQVFTVGKIYYFGYAGLDLKVVRERLAVHIGDVLREEAIDGEQEVFRKTIREVTGKAPTDVAVVCCDEGQRLTLYIGLGGNSSRPLATRAVPTGTDHLEDAALKLFEQESVAIEKAVIRGAASEDDLLGYALTDDPETRRVQLEMRAYAIQHGAELERVLLRSVDVQQRRASATLLGYAERSAGQIRVLAEAVKDPDSDVRNNATRALSVLASAKGSNAIQVDPRIFIELLFSESWTDRNKGSRLLERFSFQRDPAFLSELREKAMQPLLEGTTWDAGHSYPFLAMLGRIGNIPEDKLSKLIKAGDISTIIHAAEPRR